MLHKVMSLLDWNLFSSYSFRFSYPHWLPLLLQFLCFKIHPSTHIYTENSFYPTKENLQFPFSRYLERRLAFSIKFDSSKPNPFYPCPAAPWASTHYLLQDRLWIKAMYKGAGRFAYPHVMQTAALTHPCWASGIFNSVTSLAVVIATIVLNNLTRNFKPSLNLLDICILNSSLMSLKCLYTVLVYLDIQV